MRLTAAERADALLVWEYHRMGHRVESASVAVGLGSHDLGVADVAARLYLDGVVPRLLFTGANSPTTRVSMPRGEAVHYRERAVALGVPASHVLVEPNATNTGENITVSRVLLAREGVAVTSVVLVSKPYEERRAYATARRLWPDVEVLCASDELGFEEYVAAIGDAKKVVDMLVGALQRLVVYPEQGFMIAQKVPVEVDAAFRRLCAAGFTSRLVGASAAQG
ncbi:YdcF family protein [Streptomyces sp. P38-E01]|uniref:YdcF family protein n=1 Tax=Streptomyces tardus TaxID=2780544 RepID=A0A949JIP0_9ACTN|nr:YdcF family protein [Streptomyces tardus]MBU7599355.1 YdcF family protein [Streptomyces tardus]